jgi:hypothetical protein
MYSTWEKANIDTTWDHLLRAIGCDSTDGNAWVGVWLEAMRRGDNNLETKALRKFIETGFLAPPVLAYNSWVLRNLPQNAILLTNGDMDTYPALALQQVKQLRPDIGIVNVSLLNLKWYARTIGTRYSLPLPFSDAVLDTLRPWKAPDGTVVTVSKKIVAGWMDLQKQGKFPRPLAIAATVADKNYSPDSESRMKICGPYFLCFPNKVSNPDDSMSIRKSLADINPKDFIGSFASPNDRSPIRAMYSDQLATNITALAVRYGDILLRSGRMDEAAKMATWADEFEKSVKAAPAFIEEIKKLKEATQK